MILLAALLACRTKEPVAKAPVAEVPAPAAAAAAPLPDGSVADVFGVNEALAVPDYAARTSSTEQIVAQVTEDAARVRSLGVRHVRLHSAVWPWLSYSEDRKH